MSLPHVTDRPAFDPGAPPAVAGAHAHSPAPSPGPNPSPASGPSPGPGPGPTPHGAGRAVAVTAVDDHAAILLGVRAAFEQTGRAVRLLASAPDVPSLLAAARADAGGVGDVVLLDLNLADASRPGHNVRALRAVGARVLLFSVASDPAAIREAVAAGALGLVAKAEPLDRLVTAVQAVAQGQPYFTAEWAAALAGDRSPSRPALSQREAEALRLYATGLPLKSVARRMGLKPDTAKEYLDRVRRKYAEVERPAQTKLELYRRAVEDGLLGPAQPPSSGPRQPQSPQGAL